jgi:predicted metalloprotease
MLPPMKWSRGHTSGIEDRRAEGGLGGLGGFGMGGGGGIPIPVGIGGTGGLIVVVIIVVLNLLASSGSSGGLGGALQPVGGQAAVDPSSSVDLSNNGDLVQFAGYVLDDTNQLWADTFQRAGKAYTPTRMVLFTNASRSGCGPADSQTGPFYCPLDQKVYLDLGFFQELSDRFGAPGDFAQAYVIAHEVGHHVQQQTGIEQQVQDLEQQDPTQRNALSVKVELQADCLAGVWAYSVYKRGDLDPGDVDEALTAASAVGDDRIQKAAGQRVNPETWTHGSAAERSSWFKKGMAAGDPGACDTFSGQ